MNFDDETLDELIRKTGLKQSKIAETMGISKNYWWRLRNNPQKMTSVQMANLAVALNVSVERVFQAINTT